MPNNTAVKKRGRPRTPYCPESLLPFRNNEITTLEKFTKRPVKKSVKKKRPTSPVTSMRDYDSDEIEFMNALTEFKHVSGHIFPTCSEILCVLKNLGYAKIRSCSAMTE